MVIKSVCAHHRNEAMPTELSNLARFLRPPSTIFSTDISALTSTSDLPLRELETDAVSLSSCINSAWPSGKLPCALPVRPFMLGRERDFEAEPTDVPARPDPLGDSLRWMAVRAPG